MTALPRLTLLLFTAVFMASFNTQTFGQGTGVDEPLETYTQAEILKAAEEFFGTDAGIVSEMIAKTFAESGEPSAFVTGTEGPGEIELGYRYGEGRLHEKKRGSTSIYWRGPSIGFDHVPEDTKLFILVYNLHSYRSFYKKYQAGETDVFIKDGMGLSYKRRQQISLAFLRNWEGTAFGLTPGWIKFDPDPMVQPNVIPE